MTDRADAKIAKAKAAYKKHEAKLRDVSDKLDAKLRKLHAENRKIYASFSAKMIEARKALEVAEFEKLGVTIGKTVVLYHERFEHPLSMNRCVVVFRRSGYCELQRVTKAGKIMYHLNPVSLPYDLSKLIRTDDEVTP